MAVAEEPEALWANHAVDRPGAGSCSCGAVLPDGLAVHLAALLGLDEAAAREALLEAHNNVEINAGMCGGCDTCGSEAAMAVCRICGEGYSPCPTYYEASRHPTEGPAPLPAFPSTEGPR